MMPAMSVSWNSTRRVVRKGLDMDMKNVEARMTNDEVGRLRHSSFVIRHFPLASFVGAPFSFLRRASLISFVGNERHKPCSLNRPRDSVLARCSAAGLAAADDASVAVGQLAKQIKIFVVDEHRTRTHAVDANRVFLSNLDVGSFGHGFVLPLFRWGEVGFRQIGEVAPHCSGIEA